MGRPTPASYRDAAMPSAQALAADPALALAWAGRAHAAIGLHGMSPAPDDAVIAEARDAVARALALDPGLGEARAALAAALERFGAAGVGTYRMAIAHARLGEPDAAFAWLDRAGAARDLNLVCLAVDPSVDALRDDARWPAALARYGLPVIDPRRRGVSGP